MSWFNASHLSSFAKQALTTAQKSIDRVLDIKEEDQWGDTVVMPYDVSGGWGMTQWEAPSEEEATALPLTSEAITTPVTRTVVDESENFFSAFLSPGDVPVTKTKVVSVPPAKSQRRTQENEKKNKDIQNEDESPEPAGPAEQRIESRTVADNQPDETKSSLLASYAEAILLQPISPVSSSSDHPFSPDCKTSNLKTDAESITVELETESEGPPEQLVEKDSTNSSEPSASEAKSSNPADPTTPTPSKEVFPSQKDSKAEDRQNDTPSPPVSAFSSGTSTTSDIEVLDHESVLSESSASSRQETGESKAGLHLMQGSFQLLTASTCGDFARLEDYQKLTESCGSSSDAFERIDSFSVQSLDSRSVSEVNSDDEVPGSRTLASVIAGSTPLTVTCEKREEGVEVNVGEENDSKVEGHTETGKEQSLDEMEESGRSATPVIDDLSSRLEKRESQLLAVSKDKARLEEECDNLKEELAELHKAHASRASEAEEAALSREIQAKEKLSLALEKAQEEARIQQEALANQAQLAVAVEKERSAAEELLSIKSQLASLESQNSLLRQEKARVLAQLEAEKSKREKLEDESSR
ncbi:hypothetical protein XENOCAPTIV_013070 [Xenoophorus captivus]|uniref:TATA element modulatory factor 1 n=1 Tax=Xenoophorus captivus TaxID=1517983 RepID=A0ABV0RSW4_9TELE